jgi:alpha-glucosidase
MRQTQSLPLTLTDRKPHALHFSGPRSESASVIALDHDLIRVVLRPDGPARLDRTWLVRDRDGQIPLEGRQRDDLSPFALPVCEHHEAGPDAIGLQTNVLRLQIRLDDFGIDWFDTQDQLIASDTARRAYAYDRAGGSVFHYMRRRPDEHYYGFGETSGPLDKYGRRIQMVNLDAIGYDAENGDPLYKHIPFYITFIPSLNTAYGLFYDNLAATVFDMGQEIDGYHGAYRKYQAQAGDLDYTLIYGPTIPEVIAKFTRLTGRMALPPRWALGYLGSTMSYTEAPNAQERLREFIELCVQHDIPCDMFHLSSGYTTAPDGTRYVFTWNESRIPDRQQMAADFHEARIKLAANVKPYMLTSHPYYDAGRAIHGFIQAAEEDRPELVELWSGGVFQTAPGAYVDFTNPDAFAWWQDRLREALLTQGIDAIWNDNNEFQLWDGAARCHGFGQPIPVELIRPVQTLLMTRAAYDAQLTLRPDERPYLLCRSGCPGIQSYAQTWSGDNHTSWNTLRYNIPMGLGMSLSGAPNTGHDVGGFVGPAPDPELWVRWVQNGVLHPRFTIHSLNADGTVNEPWMYPEVLPIVREAIHFRYRLMPYLYTLFFESAQTGQPIIRPIVYDFPQDPHCHTESFDFMLGPNLLVASVLEPGVTTRQVYLPQGRYWCDFHTGQWYGGGQTVDLSAPLDRIPLLVPDGGIIPMGMVRPQNAKAVHDERRMIHVFPSPGHGTGHFRLIEDDGISFDYQRGAYSVLDLRVESTLETITLSVEITQRGYPLPYETIEWVLPVSEKRQMIAANLLEEWYDADARRHVEVSLA